METYSWLRAFADSWMLLLMTVIFVGIVIFAFRPGSRKVHEETSSVIFRNDDKPAPPENASTEKEVDPKKETR